MALQTRLAHVRINNSPIPVISQDKPLPGGYLGTALTSSLCPEAHLQCTLGVIATISKAVLNTPLPPDIKQRLLLYGATSKIMHTHCLMALSPAKMNSIDSSLEATCRKIWRLPKGFPRAGLHAPLGLNLPTIWEEYCAAATNSWTNSNGTAKYDTVPYLYGIVMFFTSLSCGYHSFFHIDNLRSPNAIQVVHRYS
jgi:hypothetical protein